MSINTTVGVEITPDIITTSIEETEDLVVSNVRDVCVQDNEELIDVIKKEYAIVGDALFASVSTDAAPDWLTGLIDNVIASALASGLSDYNQLRADVLAAIDAIDVAQNTYVEQFTFDQDVDSAISARLATLNATLGITYATKVELDVLYASTEEALALSVTDLRADFTDDINARATDITTAFSNADSALASDITALTASFTDQASDVQATADAVSGLQTYVGVDSNNSPDGTGLISSVTSHSSAFTNLANNVTGPAGNVAFSLANLKQDSFAYADAEGARVENNFGYDSTIILDGVHYKSGFGISASGSTAGDGSSGSPFDSEFWINAERLVFKSPTYPGVEAAFNVTPTGLTLGVEYTEATRNEPKGAYSAGTAYVVGDVVSYNGSSFISLVNQTAVTPVDGANWQLLSAVGATGAAGATGATGPQGPAGANGANGAAGERGTATLSYSGDLGSATPGSVASSSLAASWNAVAPAALAVEKDGDTLIVTNTNVASGWTHIYEFNGASWVTATALTVNGNQVVTGTLSAGAIGTGSLISNSQDTNGPLFELNMNGIATFRGIEIKDSSNNVILASGAAMDYSAIGGTKPPSNANFVNNTNQLTDGASLGQTATWSGVGGAGRPADNADVTSANTGGNGSNICHPRYSTFQDSSTQISNTTNGTAYVSTSRGRFGSNSLLLIASAPDCYTYLAPNTSNWNIPVEPNTSYIVSAYVYSSVAGVSFECYLYEDTGSHRAGSTIIWDANTWTRVSCVITTSATAKMAMLRIDNEGGAGSHLWVDGIMVEPQIGGLTLPAPYVPPNSFDDVSSRFVDQGAFATLNQITSGNIGTYMAAAAIGTAYIGDLQVSTVKIQDQAVTIPVSMFTSGATSNIGGSSWVNVQSAAIVSTGAPMLISFHCDIKWTAGSGTNGIYEPRILDNGVVLNTFSPVACVQANDSKYAQSSFVYRISAPTPGFHTISVQLKGNVGSVGTVNCLNRGLTILETKK